MKEKLFKIISLASLGVVAVATVSILTSCKVEEPTKQEIVFRSNGGTSYYNVIGYEGDTIALPTPEKEGYEFIGWFDNAKLEGEPLGETYTITVGCNLFAGWDPYEGTIKFESNGGTKYDDLVFSAQKVELPIPEREGFIFGGWYLTEGLTGDKVEDTILPTGDMTVYASWDAITGSVTFVSNGGTEYEKVLTAGQKVKLPSPTKQDEIFAGWYDNAELKGKAIEGDYLPEGDVTLYARWAIKYQLITFEENEGYEVSDIKLFDDDILELPTPERWGYQFAGWYENKDFEGQPVDDYFYRPLGNVTLYAKWTKCTYLYLFYGETMEWQRFEYLPGDVVTVEELNSLYTPEDLTVTDFLGNEHLATFMYWEHQGYDVTENTEVTEPITIGDDFIILSAKYDTSNVPADQRLTYDSEAGVWTTTGKQAYILLDAPTQNPYVYSVDFTMKKSTTGAFGAAVRMDTDNVKNHFEAGCDYFAAVIGPASGNMSFVSVINGAYKGRGSVALGSLPLDFQEKFNSAGQNDPISFTMTMIDYGTSIEIYLDGDYAATYSNTDVLALLPYTKLGFRSSTYPVDIYNPRLSYGYNISFNTNDSSLTADPIKWYCGDIELPYLEKENYALEGWYYDEACTQIVDFENLTVTQDTTLHAKWATEYHVITLDTDGGSTHNNINWVAGKIQLPTPTKMNHIFTGWYYDEACTQEVDINNFNITSDVTLYAGWRLPYHKFSVSLSGVYTHTASSVAVVGTVENPIPASGTYVEYSQVVSSVKGTGSAGIAFRMDIGGDNQYESGDNNYLSVQIAGNLLRISRVKDGDWTRLVSDRALTTLPSEYQEKYNAAAAESVITTTIIIRDYGTYFEVYLDGNLAYTYDGTTDLTTYTGNGYGIRSSAAGSSYKDMTAKVVTIENA